MNEEIIEQILEDYLAEYSLEQFLEEFDITPREAVLSLYLEGLLDDDILETLRPSDV